MLASAPNYQLSCVVSLTISHASPMLLSNCSRLTKVAQLVQKLHLVKKTRKAHSCESTEIAKTSHCMQRRNFLMGLEIMSSWDLSLHRYDHSLKSPFPTWTQLITTFNALQLYDKKPIFRPSLALTSCKTKGRRVTIPDPRGKKSLSQCNTSHQYVTV